MAVYLADASIWAWADKDPESDLAQNLAERFERDEVVTSPVVLLEALHRARTGDEYESLFNAIFAPLRVLPLTTRTGERALQVQRELAAGTHGSHRRPAADFLIAAVAEEGGADVSLWFFDKDLQVICDHTGQPYQAEAQP